MKKDNKHRNYNHKVVKNTILCNRNRVNSKPVKIKIYEEWD